MAVGVITRYLVDGGLTSRKQTFSDAEIQELHMAPPFPLVKACKR